MRITTRLPLTSRRGRRRGVVLLMELLFVVPILLMFLLGIMQFYMIATARQEMLAASRTGVRVAACGDRANRKQVEEEVDKTVHRALGGGSLGACEVKCTWPEDLKAKE